MKYVLALAAMILMGCSTAEVSPEGKTVKIMKADPPDNCEQIGPVDGEGLGFQHWKPATQHARLRNRAAEMGGNYVRLDHVGENYRLNQAGGIMSGTVFKCPSL